MASFQRALLGWYELVKRDLPWRRSRDPYRIWISEIMLQQTRVAAAIPFYERFLARFPSLEALASAAELDVLEYWAGLGYYSRARNLHRAARQMAGVFPSTVEGLLALPGVGEYTAAAIGSMAFGLPVAAVDGNLLRVIARLENDAGDVASPVTRKRFTVRAQALLDQRFPGEFNQAMMELGATVCVPKAPRCGVCPVAALCAGRAAGRASELPIKGRKQAKVEIELTVLVIRRGAEVLLSRRGDREGQMAGFWELPVVGFGGIPGREVGEVRHTITHYNYLYRVHAGEWKGSLRDGLAWKRPDEVLLTTAAKKALVLGS